jgi:hypothetical protein
LSPGCETRVTSLAKPSPRAAFALALLALAAACGRTSGRWTYTFEVDGRTEGVPITVEGVSCREAKGDPARLAALRLGSLVHVCERRCGFAPGDPAASAGCRVGCVGAAKRVNESCVDGPSRNRVPWPVVK